MFIAIEGIDGSGKSTLSKFLYRDLSTLGYDVFLTREPTERFHITNEESSRHDVETAMDLFFRFTTDRFSHQSVIKDQLQDGKIVISDRYLASSLAYQGALLEPLFGSLERTVEWMLAVSDVIDLRPDMTLFLDVDPGISLERIRNRTSISGFESVEYLSTVRKYYKSILGGEAVFLDSSGSLNSLRENALDEVQKRIG